MLLINRFVSFKTFQNSFRTVLFSEATSVKNRFSFMIHNANSIKLSVFAGKLYVFVLNYDDSCPDLNFKAENAVAASRDVLFSLENENQKKIEQCALAAYSKKKKISGLRKSKYQIRLEVNGIFIQQDVLYLRVVFENKSKINYDIDQLRFFIRDKRKSKRTASQEIELEPLYATSSSSVIPYKSEIIKVYALEKFTIPENKYLTIQMIEKNGGRHLKVDINNNLTDLVFPISELSRDTF